MWRRCKEYAEGAGFSEALVGLSGGIDSSVVAVMCVDAFGADHVHGVLLPGPYSSDHSCDDALELAQNLGVATETVSICEPFQAFENVLAFACGGELSGLAAENTQARCRMVCLMALSNTYGWMLVNTGNKSEACMGYSTLYGDTAGAFAPLGGLYKTDVYAVGRARNAQAADAGRGAAHPRARLHEASQRRACARPGRREEPGSGLRPARQDPDRAGGAGRAVGEASAVLNVDPALVARIAATTDAYAFKRALEPPFPQARFYD